MPGVAADGTRFAKFAQDGARVGVSCDGQASCGAAIECVAHRHGETTMFGSRCTGKIWRCVLSRLRTLTTVSIVGGALRVPVRHGVDFPANPFEFGKGGRLRRIVSRQSRNPTRVGVAR